MLHAAVPKAPVNENRKPLAGKHEIGFSSERPAAPPAGDSMLTE